MTLRQFAWEAWRNFTFILNLYGKPGTISNPPLLYVAQSHIHREFLWQPWYNFMQGVVQIAATKCEKCAVQSFMQGACKIVVAKSGKGAVQGVVQGTVQGGVEGAVQTAVAMSCKSAVCKV